MSETKRVAAHPDEYARALGHYRAGRLRDALQACIVYLGRTPTPHPPTLILLGRVLHESGHHAEAALELERALSIVPGNTDGWVAYAQVCIQQSRRDDARRAIENALKISPLDAQLNAVSAGIALELGDVGAAATHARRATQLDPRLAAAWFNLALALQADEHAAEARVAADRALGLMPNDAASAGLAAQLAAECDDLVAASRILVRAVDRHPHNVALLTEQAWVAARADDLPAAIAAYERVLALQPRNGAALSQLVFCKKLALDWTGLGACQQQFRDGVAADLPLLTPFSFLSDPSIRAEQMRCAKTWSQGFAVARAFADAPAALGAAAAASSPQRRIRIGYLSGDFYQHPTGVLLAGVLEQHDRAHFEVFAYSTGPDDGSAMRERIIGAVEHFVDIRDRRPERLASRIAADALDVLIDLKGHTEGAPTAALAMRPAPIQAHWIGYPGTLGAAFIDYLLVDRTVVPPSHAQDYTESLVWLPHCYQPNDRSRVAAVAPSRASLGLPDACIVFASFNAPWKFNPALFDSWARILAATPQSVLWLLARDLADPVIANARRELADRGIAPERVVFATRRTQADYLALYEHADLFLDTWPYNAHTTASDALWMGCPLVTLLGETFAGRVGASLLESVALSDLVTPSTDAYVALATALARDKPARLRMRELLHVARAQSPLYDASGMARHIESACERMIEQRRNGKREGFEVIAS